MIKISRIDKKIVYSGSTPGDQFGIYGNNTKLIKLIKNYNFIDIETGLKKLSNGQKIERKKLDNNLEEIDYDIFGNDYNLELNKIAKENIENYNLLFEIVCQNNSENKINRMDIIRS